MEAIRSWLRMNMNIDKLMFSEDKNRVSVYLSEDNKDPTLSFSHHAIQNEWSAVEDTLFRFVQHYSQ